ncbi:MAG: hypothetical protein Q8M76_14760 [Spirochaetaceae bacterium]|nr:hypothetical protein [Spirochaetaceae bacterium]
MKAAELARLAGADHGSALAARGQIAELALAARNASAPRTAVLRTAEPRSFGSVEEYARFLAGRTVCLTLLAGAGSRWVASLAAARERGDGRPFDPTRPRGLYPVRDFLTTREGGGAVPIAAYAIAATRDLGRRVIVVRGWEREIEAEILEPIDQAAAGHVGERTFFEQEAPFGKPLGHGDAAWQCRSLWAGAEYVVANFGGDANSRRTILSSLLALDALCACGQEADLLIPAARVPDPAYPIRLDEAGLPRDFGHAKLRGHAGASAGASFGYTNVGVRVYRASALLGWVTHFRSRHWVPGEGYSIPGNDAAGKEFALDNVDAMIAADGRARILAIARPEELTPAKSVDDIPAFERAVESVVREDRAP